MIEILKYVTAYLAVGCLFMLVVERYQPYLPEKDRLTDRDKIVVILLWPISVIVFLRGYVQGMGKH